MLNDRMLRAAERVLQHVPQRLRPPFLRGPHDGSLNVAHLPETHEGHSIWDRYCPLRPNHYCTEDAVTVEARDFFHRTVAWHRRLFERPRFVSKNPRHALRLRYLHALFPNAHFVHLVRDGRAVVASLLKRRRLSSSSMHRWWGARPPGWQAVRSRPPLDQCAWQWRQILHVAEQDAAAVLSSDQYTTLHYETLAREPASTLDRLFRAVGLSVAPYHASEAGAYLSRVYPPQASWRNKLTADQQDHLNRVLQATLARYGYHETSPTASRSSGSR